MHLFKKWSKYAIAYESMQMHNYPKPIHKQRQEGALFEKYSFFLMFLR